MKISFITIGTKNLEKSVKFYEDILGFTLYDNYSPSPDVKIAFLADENGFKLELIDHVHVLENQHNNISIGFEVDDIEETKVYLEKSGVKIVSGPTVISDGTKLLHAKDPNGVNIGFIQLKEQPETSF